MEDKRVKEAGESEKNAVKSPYLTYLLIVLLIKAALILCVILYAGIGLGPDEAQYWTWSQELAFGYYSKPPAIAWEIWSGTAPFGNTELGVRAPALLIGSLLPLTVFFLGRAALLSAAASFWAALIMALTPLGIMASFLAITDGGMVLMWTCASLLVVRGLNRGCRCSYYVLGVVIAVGALFKWLMFEFWIPVAVIAVLLPQWRSWHLAGGIVTSLLALIPSLSWSVTHEWATFRHVWSTIWNKETVDTGTTEIIKGNALEFLGAQAILFSPILFILLCMACWALWKKRYDLNRGLLFCGGLSAGLICVYVTIGFFKKMQGNWVDFAYPTAAVLVAWYAWDMQTRLRGWLIGGIALSVVLCSFALTIPFLQSQSLVNIPYKANPFRHNVGWPKLAHELTEAGYNAADDFLFSDKYQTTSILSFYGATQKRAYFFNLSGIRKNQFSYWPGMAKQQLNKDGWFVVVENAALNDPKWTVLEAEYKQKLESYFSEVRFLGVRPVFYDHGKPVKGAMLFKCIGYNGREPHDVNSY